MIYYYVYIFLLVSFLLMKVFDDKFDEDRYTYSIPFMIAIIILLLMYFVTLKNKKNIQLVNLTNFTIIVFLTAGSGVLALYYIDKHSPEYIREKGQFMDVWVNGVLIGLYLTSLFMWKYPKTCPLVKPIFGKHTTLIYNTIVEVLFQIAIMFIFLCVFYFTYVRTVEKKSFTTQISDSTNTIFNNIYTSDTFSDTLKTDLKKAATCYLSQKKYAPDLSVDSDRIDNNNKLLRKAFTLGIYIVGIIIVIFSFMRPYITCMNSTGTILKYIGMMIVVVALTELSYLEIFASKYNSVNSNGLLQKIYTTFSNEMKLSPTYGTGTSVQGPNCPPTVISPTTMEAAINQLSKE